MTARPITTPFHERLVPLNRTGVWKHWAGYVVAPSYQFSTTAEYYAVRNAVALLDTSPLFKTRIEGAEAEALLARVLARDVRSCRPGRAQYTCWCDERGFVLQDGVVVRRAEDRFLLTSAEPVLRHLRRAATAAGLTNVRIEDATHDFGILALQGPHAHTVLSHLTDDATPLRYFGATETTIDGCEVVLTRTGYTGDLGYELWIRSGDALRVWDALVDAGAAWNLTPIGTTALKRTRMDAGLLLMGVDFHNAAFAWVDAQKETPLELGWSWMFRKLAEDDRDFAGRAAIESELRDGSSRWTTVGLAVDVHDYERVYGAAGILPPRHELYAETTMSIYRRSETPWDYAGYASSFGASPLLQRPLALAKLPLDLATPGTEVDLEVTVIRKPENVLARVAKTPFFDPPRKTQRFDEAAGAAAGADGATAAGDRPNAAGASTPPAPGSPVPGSTSHATHPTGAKR